MHSMKSSRRPVDDYESEREESEYETEGEEEERSPPRRRAEVADRYDDEEEEEQYEEALADEASEEETVSVLINLPILCLLRILEFKVFNFFLFYRNMCRDSSIRLQVVVSSARISNQMRSLPQERLQHLIVERHLFMIAMMNKLYHTSVQDMQVGKYQPLLN